ncbi:MAG: isocitrate lyase/PEP mutase family protein [Alphaproteobacteria bacterium]|nr:isocitrate lyase/PEP mutase family protein [Alphaproteobacteria bacterium]
MTAPTDPRPDLPTLFRPKQGRNAALRKAVAGKELVVAPGSYDCITARLVEQAGFPATYVTGSGVSLSALGAPDVALMSFDEVMDRVKRIADSVSIPIIADVDTGYGGPLNIARTVMEMERSGVSAIQLEDQAWPKKCGHEPGRKLVSVEEMCGRLKAAADVRRDPDFIIIARTDARSDLGIEAALERGARFAEAGADVVFVESPESEEEMARVARTISAPTLVNMVEGGRTPLLPASQLEALGFRLAIYPNSLTRLFGKVGADLMQCLRRDGHTQNMSNTMLDHRALWDLFDYPRWVETENRLSHADD